MATGRFAAVAKRPGLKAMAFGPTDDLLLLSSGKAVELWHVPELVRRP